MPQLNFLQLCDTPSDNDWRIAVHEAGHAVFAAMQDWPIEHAAVGPNEFGEVSLAHNPIDEPQHLSSDDYAKWKAYYAAGAAAEHLVFGEIRIGAFGGGVSRGNDLDNHRTLCEFESFCSSIERALQTLSKDDVEKVATELQNRRKPSKLSGDEVYSIIGRKTPWS